MPALQGWRGLPERFLTFAVVDHFTDVLDDLLWIVWLLNKIYRTAFEDLRLQFWVEVATRGNHFHARM